MAKAVYPSVFPINSGQYPLTSSWTCRIILSNLSSRNNTQVAITYGIPPTKVERIMCRLSYTATHDLINSDRGTPRHYSKRKRVSYNFSIDLLKSESSRPASNFIGLSLLCGFTPQTDPFALACHIRPNRSPSVSWGRYQSCQNNCFLALVRLFNYFLI